MCNFFLKKIDMTGYYLIAILLMNFLIIKRWMKKNSFGDHCLSVFSKCKDVHYFFSDNMILTSNVKNYTFFFLKGQLHYVAKVCERLQKIF